MSKNNKKFSKDSSFYVPEINNVDDIDYMSDENIYDRMNRLDYEKNQLFSSGRDPIPWEIELAYFQREQSIRQIRAAAHVEYMNKFIPRAPSEEVLNSQSRRIDPADHKNESN